MRSILSAITMAALACLALVTAGHAQSQGASWTGTWSSQHGDLRLIQEGSRVYGDYAERGYFEGRVSENGTRLRGTFQYNSPRTSSGYIEFRRSGNSFTGEWSWARSGPVSASKGNWKGSLKSTAVPQLRHATGSGEHWADFWIDVGAASREWSLAGVAQNAGPRLVTRDYGDRSQVYQTSDRASGPFGSTETAAEEDNRFDYEPVPASAEQDRSFEYGSPASGGEQDGSFEYGTAPTAGEQDNAYGADPAAAPTGPWTGTFTTNHGDIRLIQIGNRVFGDYSARGYFEGCVHNGGQTLRGTFQYLSPRSKHGFIEFRLNGDRFEGQWAWTVAGLPRGTSTINWRGTRRTSEAPSLTSVDQSGTHFADMWNTIAASQRAWVLGQPGATACATAY